MDESTPLSNHYAIYDPLSGALSRRAFLEEAVSEFRKFQRYKHPFSLLVLAIERFQPANLSSDQEQGDNALKQLVMTFTQLLREQDLMGRLGQDEFGVLLLETDGERAQKTAERLLQYCGLLRLTDVNQEVTDPSQTKTSSADPQTTMKNEENEEIPLDLTDIFTISIGISTPLEDDRSFEQVFLRADQALNLAKQKGGNCVEFWRG